MELIDGIAILEKKKEKKKKEIEERIEKDRTFNYLKGEKFNARESRCSFFFRWSWKPLFCFILLFFFPMCDAHNCI
jgi:hypothetical protein